jgi:hypothetical protein
MLVWPDLGCQDLGRGASPSRLRTPTQRGVSAFARVGPASLEFSLISVSKGSAAVAGMAKRARAATTGSGTRRCMNGLLRMGDYMGQGADRQSRGPPRRATLLRSRGPRPTEPDRGGGRRREGERAREEDASPLPRARRADRDRHQVGEHPARTPMSTPEPHDGRSRVWRRSPRARRSRVRCTTLSMGARQPQRADEHHHHRGESEHGVDDHQVIENGLYARRRYAAGRDPMPSCSNALGASGHRAGMRRRARGSRSSPRAWSSGPRERRKDGRLRRVDQWHREPFTTPTISVTVRPSMRRRRRRRAWRWHHHALIDHGARRVGGREPRP